MLSQLKRVKLSAYEVHADRGQEFGLQAVQLVAEMLKIQDSITEADDPRSRQVLSGMSSLIRRPRCLHLEWD